MTITVFHEPIANLLVHIIIYTIILFGYREMVHYNDKKRLIRNLKEVNNRWLETLQMRNHSISLRIQESIQSEENIVRLNFSSKAKKFRGSVHR